MRSVRLKLILVKCLLYAVLFNVDVVMASKVIIPTDTIVITPESNSNPGLLLLPHDAAWRVDKVHSSGRVELKGIWRDRFEVVNFHGTKAWLMTQYFSNPEGERVLNNLNYVEYKSLIPMRIEQNQNPDSVWIDYKNKVVSGSIKRGEASWRNFADTLQNEVYDFSFSGLVNFLGTDLEEGMIFKIPVWGGTYNGTEKTVWTTYRIRKKIEDQFGSEQQSVWLLEISNGWTVKLIMAPPYAMELNVPKPYGKDRYTLLNFNLLK